MALTLLAVTPLVLLPSLVRARIASVLQARAGLDVSIDGVSPALHGVSLSGVHLTPNDGEGVQIDVQQLDLELGWLAALFEGSKAVKGVTANGVDAEVDVASEAFNTLREKLRSKGESSGGGGSSRKIEATKFELTVREGKQELLVVSGVEAQLSPAEITASLERVRASRPGLATAAMSGVEVTLARGKALQIKSLEVNDALLSITTPVLLTGAAPKPAQPDDVDDDDADKPAAAAPKLDGKDRRQSLQAVMEKFAPGALLELQRARIEQINGSERVPILNDVSGQLRVQEDGALLVKGKGKAQAGGKLEVDMRLWPVDLRADGQVTMSALPLTLFVPILPSVPWYGPEKSRIDAELTIKAESPARVALDGHATLRNVSLAADRLAATPVEGIALSIAGRGHWLPLARRLEIDAGSFGLGKARADVSGAVELTQDHFAFDIAANLPPTSCTDAVRSIPSALLGDMSLAQWRGTIGGKLRFQTDSRELDKTAFEVKISDKCQWELVPVLADLSKFSKPFVHVVTEPDGNVIEMETGPGTENWTPLEAMSPYFVHAVMVHEDPQFFNHKGFSPINIRNALVRDLKERRYAVGASTITMQLVKNIFLHREKTLARKIQEVLLTWWTERVMAKRDILELYFNVIEYGPKVYGIRAAAKHYWNRLPSELSPAEGVYLANILPNPKKYHHYYERNALNAVWATTLRKFLMRLSERGVYDKEATDYGLSELERFKFVKEGQAVEPRVIPGSASLLPYQIDVQAADTYDTRTFGSAPRAFR